MRHGPIQCEIVQRLSLQVFFSIFPPGGRMQKFYNCRDISVGNIVTGFWLLQYDFNGLQKFAPIVIDFNKFQEFVMQPNEV